MGILTETVEVRISSSNAEYYKNLGYEIPMIFYCCTHIKLRR